MPVITSTLIAENKEKKSVKPRVSKKKEEVVVESVDESVKIKGGRKKKEEILKVEISKDEEDKLEIQEDDSQQPLHIKRKKIPKQIKTLVWNEYIGHDIMSNKCMCCKKEKIDIRNFHCGHVIAESKGGDLTIKNLRPVCAPCNQSMGTKSMNEFTKEFFGWEV